MTIRYGYFLSSEEHPPEELVRQARLAEEAGFQALWVSDHFHPWLDEQGQSGHVWSVIGAISQATSLPITTAVTCPLVRQPPAVVVPPNADFVRLYRESGGGDRPVHGGFKVCWAPTRPRP